MNTAQYSKLTYGCETWTASERDLSRIGVVKMPFLRMAVRLGRMEGYGYTEVYEMGMEYYALGVSSGVAEWMRSILRWYGHIQRVGEERRLRKIFRGEIWDTNERKTSFSKRKDSRLGRGIPAMPFFAGSFPEVVMMIYFEL